MPTPHSPISQVYVRLIDEIRIAQLRRRFKFRSSTPVVKLLLDSYENNGGK